MDQGGMTFDPVARSDDRPVEAGGDLATDEVGPYWPGAEPPAGAGPEHFASLGSVTEPVLRALQSQMNAAASGRRGWIGPTQLLLGVLQQNRSAAVRVLTSLSVEVDELKTILTEESTRDSRAAVLSAPAEAALRRAAEEATRLEESAVGTEHLLLALAGEATGPVRVALEKVGVSQDAIRRQVALFLSQAPPKETQEESSMLDEPPAEAPPDDSTT